MHSLTTPAHRKAWDLLAYFEGQEVYFYVRPPRRLLARRRQGLNDEHRALIRAHLSALIDVVLYCRS